LQQKDGVDTEEQLHALLADKSGKQYYEEMKALDVDTDALWATIQKTLQVPSQNLAGNLCPLRDVR
jgi:hypothetical protein